MGKDVAENVSILDYYEVNFNHALQALRFSVLRKFGPASKKDPLANPTSLTKSTENGIEVIPGLEEAAEEFFNPGSLAFNNGDFRFWLTDAIKRLPDKEQRAIGLRLQGMQVESKDPDVPTISKALGCTDRTVRNLLKRAYTELQAMLPTEEE
jgi:DNA-directed RNA polymerase specialized sigma24 family protein